MKITLVRSFVIALAVVGFTASSISSASTTKIASSKVSAAGIIAGPTPMCKLNDPKGCGIL